MTVIKNVPSTLPQPSLEELLSDKVPAELLKPNPLIQDPENYRVPVLITTEYRGVFFGFAKHDPEGAYGPTIKLLGGRNIVYWDESVHGFVGLASVGPNEKCRVGPHATMILKSVTAVIFVEAAGVEQWLAQHWAE